MTKPIIIPGLLLIALLMSCAGPGTVYDLPSTDATEAPQWVGSHRAARDTIFITISLPAAQTSEKNDMIQAAQTELHAILSVELESMLIEYWDEKGYGYTKADKFDLLSELPTTMERVMRNVSVKDAWSSGEQHMVLCAVDYERMAGILMDDMSIEERAFLTYLKREMDELSKASQGDLP